jgi:hypothetical protein
VFEFPYSLEFESTVFDTPSIFDKSKVAMLTSIGDGFSSEMSIIGFNNFSDSNSLNNQILNKIIKIISFIYYK